MIKRVLLWLNQEVTAIRQRRRLKHSLLVLIDGSIGLLCCFLSLITLDDFVYYTPFALMPLFLLVALCCDRQYKVASFMLFTYFLICVLLTKAELQIGSSYITACYISLLIEAAATLSMLTSNIFERNGKYYCLVFLFAAFVHFMVISSLEYKYYQGLVASGLVMQVYDMARIYYNELILLVYIMVMVISINGINTATGNFSGYFVKTARGIQGFLLYVRTNDSSFVEILSIFKRTKG